MRFALSLGVIAALILGCETIPIRTGQTLSDGPQAGLIDDTAEERADVEYRLGVSDELAVNVFGEPELSGEFVVDGTGLVSMPLIGQVEVRGLTVAEFEERVETALVEEEILLDPQVSAEVSNYRPYFILGEVASPGEYAYGNGLTVMNAIAKAGGFTYRANRRQIWVTHSSQGEEVKYRLTANTLILPGDTIEIRQCLIC